MARRTGNKKARALIINAITKAYGKPVARWYSGKLFQLDWHRPFNQGVVQWFGSVKDI